MGRITRRPVIDGTTPGGKQPRFPGYDVLGQVPVWDDTTSAVVLSRLTVPPPVRFFTPAEQATVTALFDRLLDQEADPKLPLVEMVDARLAEAETDGWRYADLPEDGEAFRRSCVALDADAQESFGASFHDLAAVDQAAVLNAILHRDDRDWHGMVATHVWSLWTRYACTAFYSHPWAWNEIGFGGPAYPRGYKNAGVDALEPWEVRDVSGNDPAQSEAAP